jgi:hypothetical protein
MADKPMPIGQLRTNDGNVWNAWQDWIVWQSEVWIDKEANVYLVRDLGCEYALNILRFLWKRTAVPREDFKAAPLVQTLVALLQAKGCLGAAALDIELIFALTDGVPV